MAPTLRDYVTLTRGTTYKSRLLNNGGPVLLGLASIEPNGGFRRASLKTYGGESPERITLGPGDIYVSLKDVTQSGDLLGAVARVPIDVPVGRLTQDTVKLILNADAPADYLYWLLRTPQYRDYCRAHATGTTNLGLPREDFLSFPVATPSQGQQRLVELLGALDDKIELNRRMAATARELTHVIFRSRYRSDDPELPHSPLGDHVEVARGLSYTGAGLAGDGMPLHNLNSIYEGGGYKRAGIKYYRGDYQKRHLVRPGDVVVATVEQGFDELLIAFPARVPRCFGDVGLFSQDLFRLRPREGSPLVETFLYMLLLRGHLHEEVAGYANGTTINRIPLDALRKPRFAVPPRELVEEIDALVSPLFDRAEAAETESETLAELRDAVLPKLIAGELRVRDVEATVESTGA